MKEKLGNMKLNEKVNIKKAAASESKASELKRKRMDRIEHLRPEEIEKRSFEIISEELNSRGIILPKEQDLKQLDISSQLMKNSTLTVTILAH